jgi:hypothetical protein
MDDKSSEKSIVLYDQSYTTYIGKVEDFVITGGTGVRSGYSNLGIEVNYMYVVNALYIKTVLLQNGFNCRFGQRC